MKQLEEDLTELTTRLEFLQNYQVKINKFLWYRQT